MNTRRVGRGEIDKVKVSAVDEDLRLWHGQNLQSEICVPKMKYRRRFGWMNGYLQISDVLLRVTQSVSQGRGREEDKNEKETRVE